MDRFNSTYEVRMDKIAFEKKVREAICKELKISDLHAGGVVIRNEAGWRENEKQIEYFWSVSICKSFMGWVAIFAIKFGKSKFREIENEDELVQGILSLKQSGEIADLYYENNSGNKVDEFKEIEGFGLFDCKSGFTLDGVTYDLSIIANGIESNICLTNPENAKWNETLKKLNAIGTQLAVNSKNGGWVDFFNK